MRQKALCDNSAKVFVDTDEFKSRSFFSEIISSVSDVKFSKDGRYMISRDYMTLKLWDINMEARPVKKIEVHDHLKTRLVELYENDCIFDKFETAASHSSRYVPTIIQYNRREFGTITNLYLRLDTSCLALTATASMLSIANTTRPQRSKSLGKYHIQALLQEILLILRSILESSHRADPTELPCTKANEPRLSVLRASLDEANTTMMRAASTLLRR
jgi:hypothetical protein